METETQRQPLQASAESFALQRVVPVNELTDAMYAWMGVVFVATYGILPALVAAAGIQGVASLGFAIPGFGYLLAGLTAVGAAMALRPRVELGVPTRDPILAATAGGMVAWGLGQLVLGGSLAGVGVAALAAWVGVYAVQAGLLGAMFASLTRSSLIAAAYGAGFQLLLLVMGVLVGLI